VPVCGMALEQQAAVRLAARHRHRRRARARPLVARELRDHLRVRRARHRVAGAQPRALDRRLLHYRARDELRCTPRTRAPAHDAIPVSQPPHPQHPLRCPSSTRCAHCPVLVRAGTVDSHPSIKVGGAPCGVTAWKSNEEVICVAPKGSGQDRQARPAPPRVHPVCVLARAIGVAGGPAGRRARGRLNVRSA
jgi:hypothetical protein